MNDHTPKTRQEVAAELAAFIATASPELLSSLGWIAGHSRQDVAGDEPPRVEIVTDQLLAAGARADRAIRERQQARQTPISGAAGVAYKPVRVGGAL